MPSAAETIRSVNTCFASEVGRELRPARMREWLAENPIQPYQTIVRVVWDFDHEGDALTRETYGVYEGNDDTAVRLTDGDNTIVVPFEEIRSFGTLPLTAVVQVLNFFKSHIP